MQAVTHPEGTFLSSCEPVKPSQLSGFTHHSIDILIPKGKMGEKKGFQASVKPRMMNSIRFQALRRWTFTPLPVTGVSALPTSELPSRTRFPFLER